MTHNNQPPNICPVCQGKAFVKTQSQFALDDILKRWEAEVPMTFRESVWKEYTTPFPQTVTLYKCTSCDFKMFLPPISGSEDFYIDITVKVPYSPEKWEFIRVAEFLKELRVNRILDIGCGDGGFLDLLRQKSIESEYIGYEFNPDVANLTRAKGHEVYYGEFPSALQGKAPYDVICMFQVLEHLADPIDFIQKVMEIMTPNGLLIIGVPDANGPVRYFSNALTDIPPHHVSRWSESVFKQGFPRLGLQVQNVEYEPLPVYLWDSYLPVMLSQGDLGPRSLGNLLNKLWITRRFIKLLKALKVKWLPGVRGHTVLVVLKKEQAAFGRDNLTKGSE